MKNVMSVMVPERHCVDGTHIDNHTVQNNSWCHTEEYCKYFKCPKYVILANEKGIMYV